MFNRPVSLLRIEEAALLAAAIALYAHFHFSWLLFAVLFLAPDLFMLGYLANPRIGAALYNLGHFVFVPIALFGIGFVTQRQLLTAVALIWFCHIAFDRMLGYGLKYPTHFKETHLQRIV